MATVAQRFISVWLLGKNASYVLTKFGPDRSVDWIDAAGKRPALIYCVAVPCHSVPFPSLLTTFGFRPVNGMRLNFSYYPMDTLASQLSNISTGSVSVMAS
jgi:hypothetical protein